jgi:ribosomal protein L18
MVKHTTLTLIFFTLSVLANAQVVEWSNQQKLKTKTNYTRIIGESPSGIYVLRGKSNELSRDLIIEKYKSNLALEASENLEQPYNAYIEKTLLLSDGILVIASQRNDTVAKVDLICWKINSQLKRVGSVKTLLQIDASKFRNNTTFYIQQSADQRNTAIVYFTEEDKTTTMVHIVGLNENFDAAYQKAFNITYKADDAVISGVECDNEGNAYLLVDFPKGGERKRKDKLRDFFLYSYYKAIDKTLEYVIGNDTTYIEDLGLSINNTNKLIMVAGTYTNELGSQAVDGTFVYAIDAATTLTKYSVVEPLSKAFVNKIVSTLLNETSNNITNLYIRKIIPRTDGGVVLVLEKFYETRQSYTYYANGFPQTASRITYNYDEIIVLSKNGEGKTTFNEFIKKSQTSMNDGGYYSSFVLLNAQDKLAFVYNANTNDEGDIMITTLNPLGTMETKILIKALSYYVQLMPAESKQISSNSSIICTLKDRRFTLMKLTY